MLKPCKDQANLYLSSCNLRADMFGGAGMGGEEDEEAEEDSDNEELPDLVK